MERKPNPVLGDALVDAIQFACRCDHLRRELLWLHAMEKGDYAAAERLECVDPGLRDRLADVEVLPGQLPEEVYAAAWEERLEALASASR